MLDELERFILEARRRQLYLAFLNMSRAREKGSSDTPSISVHIPGPLATLRLVLWLKFSYGLPLT